MMPIIIFIQIIIFIFGIIIAYIDYKTKKIYHWQICLIFILTFIYSWMQGKILHFFFGGIAASVINLLVFCVTFFIYHSEQYGFGDVMIHICIGCYLGVEKYLNYYAITSIALGIIAIYMLAWTKQKTMPLAPFLFGSLLIYKLIGQPNLLGIYL